MIFDAIVIGLGPAGSMAAYTLAMAGFKVLAFDKERFPRYKPCGGCISPKMDGLLSFDISGCVEENVNTAVFTFRSGRRVEIRADRTIGYNVMREVFDAFLVQKARSAGVEVVEGARVKALADRGDHVTASTAQNGEFHARFAIGADGAGGLIGRECLGVNSKDSAIAITSEVPYKRDASCPAKVQGRVFIDVGGVPGGYAWVFPKKDFLSIGMAAPARTARGKKLKECFNEFVLTHPALKGLGSTAPSGWTVPIYRGAITLAKGRIIAVGDTGRLVDPFLGEGIYYAVKTGMMGALTVADSIKKGKAEVVEYQAWLERDVYPEFVALEKIGRLVYNHPRLWYYVLEREPGIMLRYFDVVTGKESAGAFYSWAMDRLRRRPWKLVARWLASRFTA